MTEMVANYSGSPHSIHGDTSLSRYKTAIAKIPSLCAVSIRAAKLGLVVDEEAGGVVERTALGWILAGKKLVFSLWVKTCQLSDSDS